MTAVIRGDLERFERTKESEYAVTAWNNTVEDPQLQEYVSQQLDQKIFYLNRLKEIPELVKYCTDSFDPDFDYETLGNISVEVFDVNPYLGWQYHVRKALHEMVAETIGCHCGLHSDVIVPALKLVHAHSLGNSTQEHVEALLQARSENPIRLFVPGTTL
ncbi:MAG: hypothetical protein AAGM67_05385, partial [Bacteroidota bacterium]